MTGLGRLVFGDPGPISKVIVLYVGHLFNQEIYFLEMCIYISLKAD